MKLGEYYTYDADHGNVYKIVFHDGVHWLRYIGSLREGKFILGKKPHSEYLASKFQKYAIKLDPIELFY